LLQLSVSVLERYDVSKVICHCSPLVLATRKGNVELVKLLLRRGAVADVNRITRIESHPLAEELNSESECAFCSGRNGDVESYSALATAAETDNTELLGALLACNPDMKIATRFTKSAMKGLLQRHEFTDSQLAALTLSLTPLGLAARAGASKSVTFLLDRSTAGSPERPDDENLLSRAYGRDDIRQARYLAMSRDQNDTIDILENRLRMIDAHQDRASQKIIIALDFGAVT
jgi:ankyrin repeat protein